MHSAVVGAERIDHGTMRTINLALLLGTLRSGPISRAELSRRTHLSKASITSLAAELAARGLVREGSPDRNGTVGRPGTMLTLEGARVCGVGLEINAEYLAVCVVDLCGTVLYDRAQPFDVASLPISDVLDEVAGIMRDTLEQLHSARRHVAQVMVSAPGVIKQPAGTVHLASNLGWRDVPLRSQLLQRLDADISLQVENDAKLAAVAEYRRYEDSDVRDLVYLSGDIGVGAGYHRGWPADARLVGIFWRSRAPAPRPPQPTLPLWPHRLLGGARRPTRVPGAYRGPTGRPTYRPVTHPNSGSCNPWGPAGPQCPR